MFSKEHKFARIPTEDDSDLDAAIGTLTSQRSTRWKYVLTASTILLTLSLITGWFSFSKYQHTNPKWSSCGDNPTTARSRDCSFDLISFAWQTPECYDAELVSDFASWDGDWSFYADDKFTIPVSQEVAMRGDNPPLFVKWDYHIVHCTFMWRQMHRAYERGWIDNHLGSYNHTLHCQKMMLVDPKKSEKLITMARVIYPECQRAKTLGR